MKIYRCTHPKYNYYVAHSTKTQRKYFKTYAEAKNFLSQGVVEKGTSLKAVSNVALRDLGDVSQGHRKRMLWCYGLMVKKFDKKPLKAISESDIDDLLNHYSNRNSRATLYRYARAIWRKIHRAGLVDRDIFLNVKMPRTTPRQVCLTVDQVRSLLSYPMPVWLLRTFILGLFAGLRTSELERLDMSDLDWAKESVIVRPGVAKGINALTYRIVPMTPPILRRKELFEASGKLVPHTTKTFYSHRSALGAAALGLTEWPKGALRHTFATYHLALTRNAGTTAYYMGHSSSDMVNRVYALPAHSADAVAYWAL